MFESIFNFLIGFIFFLICLGIIFKIGLFLFSIIGIEPIKPKTDEELAHMHETELELQKARDKRIAK